MIQSYNFDQICLGSTSSRNRGSVTSGLLHHVAEEARVKSEAEKQAKVGAAELLKGWWLAA